MSGNYSSLGWQVLSNQVTHGAKCVKCGTARDLVAHHKLPRSYGGRDVLSNLEPVCRRCHPGREAYAVALAVLAGHRKLAPAAKPIKLVKRQPVASPPRRARRVATATPLSELLRQLQEKR